MKKELSSSFVSEDFASHPSLSRSRTPSVAPLKSISKAYNPYPLYKQKIRTLLKPPDYSQNPPKFMSIRESRSEFERKEASTQVKLLKKTFNTMYQRFNSHEKSLTILKSEAIRVNALRSVGENDLENLQHKIDYLQSEENAMLSKIREETDNNTMYKHIRERMRQTLMHLEVKNQYLQDQIRLRDFLIDGEHRKKIKSLEGKFTSAQAYRHMRKSVNLDIKDRTQDLLILKDDIETRNKIHELRQTRIKKYEEIAETAANEERDLKNNNMRESVLLSSLWGKFFDFKLGYEKKKYADIEAAFQKIKAKTLISNVQDVVKKFLNKEYRLVELMNLLNKNKEKCKNYLRKNDMIEKKIDEILLTHKNGVDSSIKFLRNSAKNCIEKIDASKLKLAGTKNISEKVRVWVYKMLSIYSPEPVPANIPLILAFEILKDKVLKKIPVFKTSPFITDLSDF